MGGTRSDDRPCTRCWHRRRRRWRCWWIRRRFGLAAKNYFGNVDKKNVHQGYEAGIGMDDVTLIKNIGDYVKNYNDYKGRGRALAPSSVMSMPSRGAAVRCWLLPWMRPRAPTCWDCPRPRATLRSLVDFFGSDGVFNDDKLWGNRSKAKPYRQDQYF